MVVPKANATKEHLLKLIADRDKLEVKISEYGAMLAANGDVGMTGPLVDAQGFPRNDIDVYQVRQARQQIICLQNDHKTLMKEIEKWMHKLHAEAAEEQQQDMSNKAAGMQLDDTADGASASTEAATATASAFAKINMVSPGSPAEVAGLCVDDEIIEFGSINAANFNNDLNQIAAVVRHMQNQRVPLKIQRVAQQLELVLIPKTWSGRGLLGCNIVLTDAVER